MREMTEEVKIELREQLERQRQWAAMTPEQKEKHLLQRQKEMLDQFLERNAISRAQYEEGVCALRRGVDQAYS